MHVRVCEHRAARVRVALHLQVCAHACERFLRLAAVTLLPRSYLWTVVFFPKSADPSAPHGARQGQP